MFCSLIFPSNHAVMGTCAYVMRVEDSPLPRLMFENEHQATILCCILRKNTEDRNTDCQAPLDLCIEISSANSEGTLEFMACVYV